MVTILLVAETWSKVIDIDAADELIEAEGMSWERDPDGPSDPPRYIPAVSG